MNITPKVRLTIRQRLDWLIILSTLLILLGGAALLMPSMATLMTISTLGWILLASGVIRIVQAPPLRPMQGFWLNLLVGILYITIGVILLSHRIQGAMALTLVFGSLFIVEGIIEMIAAVRTRTGGELSGLVLLDGVFTLILGILIWKSWTNNSLWLIGLYAGISMILSGLSLLAIAAAARNRVTGRWS